MMLPALSPRRQHLQDVARVLTGLSLVLQQTAAYEARCASRTARLLYHENQHALSSLHGRRHAPPPSPNAASNSNDTSTSSSSPAFDPYAAASSSSASQPGVSAQAVIPPSVAAVGQLLSGFQSAVSGASSALSSSAAVSPLLSPLLSSLPLPQAAASSLLAAVLPPALPRPSPELINAGAAAVTQAAQAWVRQISHSQTQRQQQQPQQPPHQQHVSSYSPSSTASPSSSSSSSSSAHTPPFPSPQSPSPPPPELLSLPDLGSLSPPLPDLSALPEQLAAAGDTAASLAARTLSHISSAVSALSPPASSSAAFAGQTPLRTELSEASSAGPASSTPSAPLSPYPPAASQPQPPPSSLPGASSSAAADPPPPFPSSSLSSASSASASSSPAGATRSPSTSASASASSPFPSPSSALSSLNSAAQAASSRLQQTSSSIQQTAQAFLPPLPRFNPRERAVPSSPLGRMFGFGGIALRMMTGSLLDATKRLLVGGAEGAEGAATAAAGGTEREDGKRERRGQQADGVRPETSIASTLTSSSAQPLHSPVAAPSTAADADSQAAASSTSMPPSASAASFSSSAPPAPSGLSRFMSPANTERLAAGLCRMRGAALKVGQMLSIQDESLLPPQLQQVLNRVRDSADVMPRAQLERTLRAELGDGWERKLSSFDWSPIAAASIGQVHRGVEAEGGRAVVLKVQYPGVADSIGSDVNNVRLLIRLFNVLPPGLYIDQTMAAAKEELSVECDYRNEADSQTAFQQLIRRSPLHPRVNVPSVVPALSTSRVLTSEWVAGAPIDHCARDGREALSQERRNALCLRLLRLCLLEVFDFRFMQTDPNWSNFLYDAQRDVLHCVDFGASREYDRPFVDEYMRMVAACADRQRDALIASSIRLGFLTGQESRQMLDAHVAAGFIVGEPFSRQYASGYDFASMDMGRRVSELARVMLRLRLTPPPKDSYTLHRKLSGCFLTCRRLEAVIPCREAFLEIYNNYQFGEEDSSSALKQPQQQPEHSTDTQPLSAAVNTAHAA